jgi:hypothetical protein
MTSGLVRWPRIRPVAGAAALLTLLGAGAWFFFFRHSGENSGSGYAPALLTQAEGDLLYTFFIPTGGEELFDTKADPGRLENLSRSRPADTARLRRLLTERLGIADLEDLRKNNRVVEALRNTTYLR